MDDVLKPQRDSVGKAIASLRNFAGLAGSEEMRQVQQALDYLGFAYSILQDNDDNPAWSED